MAVISTEETLRRQRMVASVIGTHAMEGIEPDSTTLGLFRRYESGELNLDEFGLAMDTYAAKLVAASRQLAGAA